MPFGGGTCNIASFVAGCVHSVGYDMPRACDVMPLLDILYDFTLNVIIATAVQVGQFPWCNWMMSTEEDLAQVFS